jgi:hypothetical protein
MPFFQRRVIQMMSLFKKKPVGQMARLKLILSRKEGATAAEIARYLPTTSPHSKLARLERDHLWTVLRKDNNNGTKQYFGKPPKTK